MNKFRKYIVLELFILFLLFYSACTDSGTDPEDEIVLPESNLTFYDHIQPLFFSKCCSRSPCHSQIDHAADLVLSDYNSVIFHIMPGGGNLYIQTENIFLDRTAVKAYGISPGKYVKVSITDTGIRMDEKTVKMIFDPFFTTKVKERRTAMGLASAYCIVKNHKGVINVYSEPG